MAALKSPFDGGVIDVPDDLTDRYTAAGWVEDKPRRHTRVKRNESDDDEK